MKLIVAIRSGGHPSQPICTSVPSIRLATSAWGTKKRTNTLFGGTAEFVALYFKQIGIEQAFYIYVSVMIAISLIIYIKMPDTRRHSQIRED